MKKKVQVSLDEELWERLNSYAEENYMTRSGVVSLASTQFLNAHEGIRYIREIAFAMKKIAETGEVDEETAEKLEDLERLSRMIGGAR